ncbi:class I SAM-dependent methyltransferase [Zunongwangia sp. F363]|uniref:Class I SAM-dependent methyltransferase n=1 Tax=Autumnicola tepida TaxID=3075595 RepID=A0ABU3C987_9FLAO|nr:class I SAM-dependent methyltransferase [Zunongwangia sp. F363]MDT0642894.1 class I SAM-dependent methyltransferase [Zunongwangia sp. F363]
MLCSLCNGRTRPFHKWKEIEYARCKNCKAVLLLPQCYLPAEDEKNRYLRHNNDVADLHYIRFTAPITNAILEDFPKEASGLDYGCGTGPVIANQLQSKEYNVALYDYFFKNDKNLLKQQYDFIICSEVMEHFHYPAAEFRELAAMLNPGGKLYCKTSLYSEAIDFENWYYKNDNTHVIFYTEESLQWIRENMGFASLRISEDLIVFRK